MEEEIKIEDISEIKQLIASMPDDTMVVVSFGEEELDGKKE